MTSGSSTTFGKANTIASKSVTLSRIHGHSQSPWKYIAMRCCWKSARTPSMSVSSAPWAIMPSSKSCLISRMASISSGLFQGRRPESASWVNSTDRLPLVCANVSKNHMPGVYWFLKSYEEGSIPFSERMVSEISNSSA